MRPIDVSRQLQMGESTVRRWSDEFRAFLSPTAVGGDGARRDYTALDVQIMALIKRRVTRSVPREILLEELRRFQAGDWRELPPLIDTQDEPRANSLVPMATAHTAIAVERQGFLREIASLEKHIEELEGKLDERDADKEKLFRELVDKEGQLQRAYRDIELYEQGRLKPRGS